MHNLGAVTRFEITRALKKKSFWVAALSFPVIAGLVGIIIFFSNQTTSDQAKNLANEKYSLGITDNSTLISPEAAAILDAKTIPNKAEGIAQVQNGQLEAYFYYPSNVSENRVEVYGKDVGLFKNSRYQDVADQLLKQSVASKTDKNVQAILQSQIKYSSVTYTADGNEDKGFLKLIAPGLFLVLFYFMIATFGNQILTSITEEKENRVIEMILATIKPTTLLVGKLLSLISLAFIQLLIIMVPIIAGYFILKDQLSLPQFDLSSIPLDPLAISIGAIVFLVSFLLYAGILMTLGAAMPTAKEAGGFFGAAMALLFGPLYAASLFISSPESLLVQVLSYFPLTAPIPLLLRNAAGNLSLQEAAIAISILFVTTVLVIAIGVRIFRFGALEYSRRLTIKEVIGRKK